MAIDFATLWHVGITVPDLDTAMKDLSAATGWEWTAPLARDVTITVGGSDHTCPVRWAANKTAAPQLEVIEAHSGLWAAEEHPGHRLHHLAYWSTDLEGDASQLEQTGYLREAFGLDEHGRVRFIYLLTPSGIRIELGALWSKDAWDSWTAGDDYTLGF